MARAFPLPEQIAAIVAVLDALPADGRQQTLAAFNSQSVSVAVSQDLPAEGGNTQRLPLIENLLRGFAPLQQREVRVMAEVGVAPITNPGAWLSGVPLMVVAQLANGEFVVIRTPGMLLPRLFGIPNGFWLAAASLFVAAVTLVALVRETRPLRDLTTAMKRFSEDATPARIKPAGAADVRDLIDAVNRMQERIGALVKGRTILAGAISHDLKTYLTRLQLRTEEIPVPEEREAAERDIAAMLAIVENAMSFAKSAAGTRDSAAVDLGELAKAEIARLQSPQCPIALRIAGTVQVLGDTTALTRVLGNLLENAKRYATTATVTLWRDAETAVMIVDDNGPGIPDGEREAVFEPFYRLDPSRSTQTGGSGLGLALCRQIVEAHGGRIWMARSPLGGAQVRVELPSS
jgi:two-component system osmolarity sensor histidine kinase EnvZ